MTHDEIRALLPWYAKRALGAHEQDLVARHAKSCPDCARELEDIDVLLSASEHLNVNVPEPSTDLLERTLEKISRHESNQPAPKRWWIPLALAASLTAVIVSRVVLVPTTDSMDHAPSFSTGGNAYQAELILELLTDEQIEIREIIDILYFAS
jgi:hypothetical protein